MTGGFYVPRLFGVVVAINRVMPSFYRQIRIIPGATQRMDDLGPIALAQAHEAMFGDARITNAILLQQRAIDESVLGMDVKDARAELVDVRHRIDELADQMARIPLQAEVLAFGFIENPFPDVGLAEHVVMHDRQMIRALRAMLESDPHPALGGELRQRLPK